MGPFPTPTLTKESSPGQYFDNDNDDGDDYYYHHCVLLIVNDDDDGESTPDQDYADVLSTQPSAIMLSLTAVS